MSFQIIQVEKAITVFGIPARAYDVVANTETGIIRNQKIMVSRSWNDGTATMRLNVSLRFDDKCGNGHETFSITGDLYDSRQRRERGWVAGGCLHEEIAERLPELAHLIRWHLVSTDGPMHYVANTLYHASDRDHNGLLSGEKRQIKNGKTGLPVWHLVAVDENGEEVELYKLKNESVDAEEKPTCKYSLEYRPWCCVGEGKARNLEAARNTAVWPDATDEQLSLPRAELEKLLLARLPALKAEFKAAMLSVGFLWPDREGI